MTLGHQTEPATPKQGETNWGSGIFLIAAHLAAVAALFFFSWTALITAIVLYWAGGSLGIGMGWHRLLTHRGYKVPKAVEYFLVTCGTLALEGGPIQWVVTHRIHHAHTDREGDPHTPRDGGWWAHIGWILRGTARLRWKTPQKAWFVVREMACWSWMSTWAYQRRKSVHRRLQIPQTTS